MKVLSLFSGVGGFDMGLENAGMETVFQCEWDKHANTILNKHWPHVPKWDDVSTLTGKHILAGVPVIDVVAWGSPCQDLSVVGKRGGLKGERSELFYEGIRIIKELRKETNGQYPRISIWENVAGALNSNRGADFGIILDEMAEAGALVIEWAIVDAQYWLPQRRRRVFVIAIFDPAIAERCPSPLLPVAESLRRNETENGYFTFYTSQGKRDQYTKNICTTLKVAGIACIVGNDIAPRKLTPLESERLMGWPDNWTEGQADTHRYKQCGLGVASPVAQWIGKQLINL
jgi:DNA (cytosine-5)-methyltransferase 1